MTVEPIEKPEYKRELIKLQIQLVMLQKHIIESGKKALVIFEGRDASGKDGTIKRLTAHASPRDTRVVALGKPRQRDVKGWYFQRYVPHLPIGGELVYFNRSWYNRAGVEPVMGYCSEEEYEEFMATVVEFERLLTKSGFLMLKYYLDISKEEQQSRLESRRNSLLKQWKISEVDKAALERWDAYTFYKDAMLQRTHSSECPWRIVQADDKRQARLNVMRDILVNLGYPDLKAAVDPPLREVVAPWESS
ncbi:MAG: hypothetical protein PsegKO_25320 [Pseudohongiellaceae bacterium]|jgi:polyphosphate kinase 2